MYKAVIPLLSIVILTSFLSANAQTGVNKTIEDVNNAIQNFESMVYKMQQQWIDAGCIPISYNDHGIVEAWENC